MNDRIPDIENRGGKLMEILIPVGFIALWIAVQAFLLPRFGGG